MEIKRPNLVSNCQLFSTHDLGEDFSDTHCVECKLKSISTCKSNLPTEYLYRSQAHPDATLDTTAFGKRIAHALLQVDHDRPHVLDLFQTFNEFIHVSVVVWSKKNASSVLPLHDNVKVKSWS
jgi:hypothetical protein